MSLVFSSRVRTYCRILSFWRPFIPYSRERSSWSPRVIASGKRSIMPSTCSFVSYPLTSSVKVPEMRFGWVVRYHLDSIVSEQLGHQSLDPQRLGHLRVHIVSERSLECWMDGKVKPAEVSSPSKNKSTKSFTSSISFHISNIFFYNQHSIKHRCFFILFFSDYLDPNWRTSWTHWALLLPSLCSTASSSAIVFNLTGSKGEHHQCQKHNLTSLASFNTKDGRPKSSLFQILPTPLLRKQPPTQSKESSGSSRSRFPIQRSL